MNVVLARPRGGDAEVRRVPANQDGSAPRARHAYA
jgi:hypothetical protein